MKFNTAFYTSCKISHGRGNRAPSPKQGCKPWNTRNRFESSRFCFQSRTKLFQRFVATIKGGIKFD